MSLKIYLAGPVPKGDEEISKWDSWRFKYKNVLGKIDGVGFIDPEDMRDESSFEVVFGHGVYGVKQSDLVVVYAEGQLGPGTSQEMIIAKYFSKPVLSVLPKNSVHRKSNFLFHGKVIEDWIHPFIYVTTDYIAENVEGLVDWIKNYMKDSSGFKIKDISIIDRNVDSYLKTMKEK